MALKKTAVLIHGYHLGAEGWEELVWGHPPERMGVISRGVLLAKELDAALLCWGTGASEKEGKKEGERMYEYALAHLPEHAEFLKEHSQVDTSAHNTVEEIHVAMEACLAQGVERLFLVAAATHAARSLNTALTLCEEEKFEKFRHNIFAAPADTSYAGHTPGDTYIMEPPHRGDRPKVPLYKNVARLGAFRRSQALAAEFNTAFGKFLDEWEKKL